MYEFDICVLGATGYTGANVIKYFATLPTNLTVCVAGRSIDRLTKLLELTESRNIYDQFNRSACNLVKFIPVQVDIHNVAELENILGKSRCVLNCTGPYYELGPKVVETSINKGCHYFDVSGENYFTESIEQKFHNMAHDKGVLVVSSCGISCLATELGVFLMRKKVVDVKHIEAYISINSNASGSVGHITSFESILHEIRCQEQIKLLRKNLYGRDSFISSRTRDGIFQDSRISHRYLYAPFYGPDSAVIGRTFRHLSINDSHQDNIDFSCYFGMRSVLPKFRAALWLYGIIFKVTVVLSKVVAHYDFLQDLMLKFPRLFTLGHFSNEGPTDKQLLDTYFSVQFLCDDKTKRITISGAEPGYIVTPCLAINFIMLALQNIENLPKGVYTPGVVLDHCGSHTNLIDHFSTPEIFDISMNID